MTAVPAGADADVRSCPKCGASVAHVSVTACPRCGLAVDKMDAFALRRDAEVPSVVRVAWERLLEAWDDEERHAAFMRIVVDENAFAWAAAQYRDKKPDPRAEAMLERVRRAAEARLATMASAKPEPKSIFHSVKILVGAAVVMIIALMLMLQFMRGKQATRTPSPPIKAPTHKVR